MNFGFSNEDWTSARRQVLNLLLETAKQKRTITFKQVAENVTAIHLDLLEDLHSKALSFMINEISIECADQNKPALSALVVTSDAHEPTLWFFTLMESLGRDASTSETREQLWNTEKQRVYETDWE